MAVLCPVCGRQYDVSLFGFGQHLRCDCGARLGDTAGGASPAQWSTLELSDVDAARERVAELQRMADRVCALILNDEYPDVGIQIEMIALERAVDLMFPEKRELYAMLYESRFARLWQQFRRT